MFTEEFLKKVQENIKNESVESNWYEIVDVPQEGKSLKMHGCSFALFTDMSTMMGIDPESELLSVLKFEIRAFIINKVLENLRSNAPTLNVVDLDVENTKDIVEFKKQSDTIVCAPTMLALIERSSSFTLDSPIDVTATTLGAKIVGSVDDSIVYRDTLSIDEYVLFLNWDGETPFIKVNFSTPTNEKKDGEDTLMINVTCSDIDYDELNPRLFKCSLCEEYIKELNSGFDITKFIY